MTTQSNNTTSKKSHSNEVHEILTEIPRWIIRWGTTIFFCAIMMLFIMSWIIQYPDIVSSNISISTTHSPNSLISRSDGFIKLFAEENALIEKGEIIAVVDNAASFDDIHSLKKELVALPELSQLNATWKLGVIQPSFNALVSKLKKINNLEEAGYQVENKKELIQRQIKALKETGNNLSNKYNFLNQEHVYRRKILKTRYQKLLVSKSISQAEYERQVYEVKAIYKDLVNTKTAINEIDNKILELKKEQQILDFNKENNEIDNQNSVLDAYSKLISQISIWEQNYVIRAPIKGKLSFLSFAKNNMFVNANQEIAQIIPNENGSIYGEAFIPQKGAGKVLVGQKVFIEIDQFPKSEFGELEGVIQSISDISHNNHFKASISLNSSLITTYDHELEYKHGMTGKAKIVTEDIRLLERFLYQLRDIFN